MEMKLTYLKRLRAIIALTFVLLMSLVPQNSARAANAQKIRYKLIDLGTLGGPISYGSVNGYGFRILNDSGSVASSADLAVPGLIHAFQWRDGVITDLGTLPRITTALPRPSIHVAGRPVNHRTPRLTRFSVSLNSGLCSGRMDRSSTSAH